MLFEFRFETKDGSTNRLISFCAKLVASRITIAKSGYVLTIIVRTAQVISKWMGSGDITLGCRYGSRFRYLPATRCNLRMHALHVYVRMRSTVPCMVICVKLMSLDRHCMDFNHDVTAACFNLKFQCFLRRSSNRNLLHSFCNHKL